MNRFLETLAIRAVCWLALRLTEIAFEWGRAGDQHTGWRCLFVWSGA
jgi:hypothetical protein